MQWLRTCRAFTIGMPPVRKKRSCRHSESTRDWPVIGCRFPTPDASERGLTAPKTPPSSATTQSNQRPWLQQLKQLVVQTRYRSLARVATPQAALVPIIQTAHSLRALRRPFWEPRLVRSFCNTNWPFNMPKTRQIQTRKLKLSIRLHCSRRVTMRMSSSKWHPNSSITWKTFKWPYLHRRRKIRFNRQRFNNLQRKQIS